MKKVLPLLLIVAIAVAVAAYFYTSVNPQGTNIEAQTNFVIEDTASIGRIFIADVMGRTIDLERKQGEWSVNGKFKARQDAVETLLNTFKNVYIQRPVAKEKISQVNKVMTAATKKVEIYNREGDWIKTWFVGHGTPDNKGTYALLETPKYGKASKPFILDKKGFIGILNARFFTSENEWRSTVIFNYPAMKISEIEVSYPNDPSKSFRIVYKGENHLKVYRLNTGNPLSAIDSSLVKDYMLNFKLASFENYKTGLSELEEDSVKSSIPYQVIKIRDKGARNTVKLWPRESSTDTTGYDGPPIRQERIYAAYNGGKLALAQRYVWDKFRAPVQAFSNE
jgi:uncharacterized protein YxeA